MTPCPECGSAVRTAFTKTPDRGEWELIAFCDNSNCEMAKLLIEGKGDSVKEAVEQFIGLALRIEAQADRVKKMTAANG